MKMTDVSAVVKNNLCYNCGACDVSCPAGAISFDVTNAGRLYPCIDHKICTNCGACHNVCPGVDFGGKVFATIQNYDDPFCGKVIGSYSGRTIDEYVFNNAQSGGVLTQTLIYLFEEKLISHALVLIMEYGNPPMPRYFFASSAAELFRSQKSIYTPVNLLSALKELDEFNGNIAIVGLPCHLEGVESLLKDKLEKYGKIKYKLGLICDGVLGSTINDFFLKTTKEEANCKIIYRNKNNPNYFHAKVTVRSVGGREWHFKPIERLILKEYITPPRCLLCFNKMNIFADIVYGDAWGIKAADMVKGESVVIARTVVGNEIIRRMIDRKTVYLRKLDFSEIYKGQDIDQRKMKTKITYKIYKMKKWQTPKYFEKLENSFCGDNENYKDNLLKQIDTFLVLETKGRAEIVTFLKKNISLSKVKIKLKLLIKKLFINLWKGQ